METSRGDNIKNLISPFQLLCKWINGNVWQTTKNFFQNTFQLLCKWINGNQQRPNGAGAVVNTFQLLCKWINGNACGPKLPTWTTILFNFFVSELMETLKLLGATFQLPLSFQLLCKWINGNCWGAGWFQRSGFPLFNFFVSELMETSRVGWLGWRNGRFSTSL